MSNILKLRIQLRRDTSANWALYNPVLLNGEAAVSSDLNQLKIGDGTSKWSELDYVSGSGTLAGFVEAESGSYPVKQEDGTLKWVTPSTNTLEGLTAVVEQNAADIAIIQATLKNPAPVQISLHDILLEQKDNGVVDIPLATALQYGVVKGSDEENQVSILDDGTMVVNSINVNRLVQTEGEELILNANY